MMLTMLPSYSYAETLQYLWMNHGRHPPAHGSATTVLIEPKVKHDSGPSTRYDTQG